MPGKQKLGTACPPSPRLSVETLHGRQGRASACAAGKLIHLSVGVDVTCSKSRGSLDQSTGREAGKLYPWTFLGLPAVEKELAGP